ncbi:hypothetical protein RIF29_28844 [Crotalaria pallida]|uniref:Uncharacterized protein n=1 Tax=Crotalaria pallida TaxID=3830 RepID=A0AAN9EIM5_CROPI
MYTRLTAVLPLIDLEQVLHSKKEVLKLSHQEESIWLSCKYEARRNFIAGALVGGTAVKAVAASWKLNNAFRIFLTSGAASSFGIWILGRSLYSCAEQILKLDGSILQKELANIMVRKYQDEPSLRPLMSKHFYSERVFDDSTSNNPKFRWRYRNFYSDNDSHDKTEGDSPNDSYNNSQGESENVSNSKRTNIDNKHIFIKADPDIMAELDPLDYIFGYGAPVAEIHHPNIPNKSPRTHNRKHRRSHRRHRMQNQDDLSN